MAETTVKTRMRRRRWVAAVLGVSGKTVAAYVRRGLLPEPARPSSRICLWAEAEVLAAIAGMKRSRDKCE
jgi:predicted DNA-binding transcriptional regulator AlpA